MPQVEASQAMIRIVGLSATLPNYKDVGAFLNVNPSTGEEECLPVPSLLLQLFGTPLSSHCRRPTTGGVCLQADKNAQSNKEVLIEVAMPYLVLGGRFCGSGSVTRSP